MFGWLFRLFGGGKKKSVAKPIKRSKKNKKSVYEEAPEFPSLAAAGAEPVAEIEPFELKPEKELPEEGTELPVAALDSSEVQEDIEVAASEEKGQGRAVESPAVRAEAADKNPSIKSKLRESEEKSPRVLLQEGAEGEYVRRLQVVLADMGFDLGEIDGVFGRLTSRAVKFWQRKFGAEPTGALTFDQWTEATGQPVPGLFERCLQVTASFEGHGFTKVAGNFDKAGLTWGLIGYNLRSRTLQPILDYFIDYHPELVRDAFGPLAEDLVRVVESPLEDQILWADSISIGTQKQRIRRDWQKGFAAFGALLEVQKMQLDQAREDYWSLAEIDMARFDLKTELGAALAFDIAVQNGGIDGGRDDGPERRAILAQIEEQRASSERDRRAIIAEVVARNCLPAFVEDVLSRKRAIALGDGMIHGKIYHFKHWGLDDLPFA